MVNMERENSMCSSLRTVYQKLNIAIVGGWSNVGPYGISTVP